MQIDLSKVKYALFDWDGTLADTREAVVSSISQVLAEYNMPSWDEVKHLREKNLSLKDNFAEIFKEKRQEAYARYVEIYKKNSLVTTKPFAYAKEVLNLLKDEGVELMILTNKDIQLLEFELSRLFNPELFSRITAVGQAPKNKPYPEAIFYTLRGLLIPSEINPVEVWMLGDSYKDSDCALAANAMPIRINKPLFPEKESISENIAYFTNFEEFYNQLTNKI